MREVDASKTMQNEHNGEPFNPNSIVKLKREFASGEWTDLCELFPCLFVFLWFCSHKFEGAIHLHYMGSQRLFLNICFHLKKETSI